MQLQVLQELATAGVDIRLATGKSVRAAYMSDKCEVRGVRVAGSASREERLSPAGLIGRGVGGGFHELDHQLPC